MLARRKKTASENIGEKRFLSPRLSPVVSLAVFRAAPQLTERLEEAKNDLEMIANNLDFFLK